MKSNSQKGFTLVELLIVISIIALLTTMVTVSLLSAKNKAKIQATRALIANIQAAIENYYGAYGDYPPTTLADMYTGGFSGNNGIESVVYCLSAQDKGGPFLLGILDSKYSNLDSDQFGSTPLRELVDEWKNPIVYFHSKDYLDPSKGNIYSFRKPGDAIMPQQNPAAGANVYYNPVTFQLWSAGPDEKNNNGLTDDINNWK
ncbi:MAG: type II secretion system protein [Planctomycetes bacterium]|nr:type II secretion system protein [Planctomycetota bacterium]